jgi:hypothetical protein
VFANIENHKKVNKLLTDQTEESINIKTKKTLLNGESNLKIKN